MFGYDVVEATDLFKLVNKSEEVRVRVNKRK